MSRTRYRSLEMTTPTDADEGVLTGYASLYETPYKIGPRTEEVIHRGAFSDSLAARAGVVPVFYGHGWAKSSNDAPIGFARVREDDKGLQVEEARLFIDSNQTANSVFQAVKAGALREWSVGFLPEKIRKRANVEGIERGDVIEISVVVKGANRTEMHSARAADETDDDVEIIDETDLGDDATDDGSTPPPAAPATPPAPDAATDPPAGEENASGETPEYVERAFGLLTNRGYRNFLSAQFQPETKE